MDKKVPKYRSADEIFVPAESIDITGRVRRQLYVEECKRDYSKEYCVGSLGIPEEEYDASPVAGEPEWLRDGRTWSELGSRVFGAEGD